MNIDTEYEKLPVEMIRKLCDMAVQNSATVIIKPENKDILNSISEMDLRCYAALRLRAGWQARDLWKDHRNNKRSGMILLQTYEELSKTQSYLSPEFQADLSWGLLTDPEVWDYMSESPRLKTIQMHCIYASSGCNYTSMMRWAESDPVRAIKTIAGSSGILASMSPRHSDDKSVQYAKIDLIHKSLGFMHLYERDRPACLIDLHAKLANEARYFDGLWEKFDDIMYALSCIARKTDKAMEVMKGDMTAQDFAGRQTRRNTEGWMRTYLAALCVRSESRAISIVKNLPVLFPLLPTEVKRKRENRSLGRLLQISGDI